MEKGTIPFRKDDKRTIKGTVDHEHPARIPFQEGRKTERNPSGVTKTKRNPYRVEQRQLENMRDYYTSNKVRAGTEKILGTNVERLQYGIDLQDKPKREMRGCASALTNEYFDNMSSCRARSLNLRVF